ncbi:hypothetical protein GCM10012275_09520 [Longimycelium tulufanense]|uniref:DUF3515 domain-containing protein n=1 Tax=Longimycelium tulufanense TaxID=907463 RepID=A0A8J3CAL5_9PSEU|nr:hypothetical protein GCM10012275_09520 [Longimycelium tulufanense]
MAAAGLAVLLAAGVATVGILLNTGESTTGDPAATTPASPRPNADGPLRVEPVAAPRAGSEQCRALLGALPDGLTAPNRKLPRRQLADPAPEGTAAWGGADYAPVVLRCGVDKPRELVPTSQLTEINGVKWLSNYDYSSVTWVVVDRPVYVSVSLPEESGVGPIQDLSDVIRGVLPAQDVDPNR